MKNLTLMLCCFTLLINEAVAGFWYPASVKADGKQIQYLPVAELSQPWRLCVLLPNGQDKFWWGAAWGIAQEADRLGIEVGIYDAGGYDNIALQSKQLQHCIKLNADAYIISAVNYSGLTPLLQQLKQLNKPVIDLMNGLPPELTTSRVDGLTTVMVQQLISHLAKEQKLKNSKVAWFPGPANSDWVTQANQTILGFLSKESAIVVSSDFATTDPFAQAHLVREFFRDKTNSYHYIIANAVAAGLIATYQSQKTTEQHPPLYAFYSNPDVVKAIKDGKIAGAPSNQPVLQARIALDLALRALEKQTVPALIQTQVIWLDRQSILTSDLTAIMAPESVWMDKRELKVP